MDAIDVVRVVREGELVEGGGRRDLELARAADPSEGDALAQAGVLGHREAVAIGEGEDEGVGVEDLHGRVRILADRSLGRALPIPGGPVPARRGP